MFKPVIICVVLFVSVLTVTAQHPVDEAARQPVLNIQKSQTDTARVKSLLALSKTLILKSGANNNDIKNADALMKQAEQLSIKINDVKSQGNCLLMAALIANKKGDNKSGFKLSQQALTLFTRINDLSNEAEAYIIIGQHYGNSGKDVLLKITYYKKAIQLFKAVGAKERQATTLTDLADFQQEASQFTDSNNNLYEALSIYRAIGYQPIQNVFDLIGNNFTQTGDLANSLKYEMLAVKAGEALKDTTLQMCTIYVRTSVAYYNLRNDERSVFYGLKALKIARKFNDEPSVIFISQGLGVCYYSLYKYVEALAILKQLPEKYVSEKDTATRVDIYCQFVLNYIKIDDFGQAKSYFDKMKVLSKPNAAGREIALLTFIKYYAATNQYQLSYPYLVENSILLEKKHFVQSLSRNAYWWFQADLALGKYRSAIEHYAQYKLLSDSNLKSSHNKQTEALEAKYQAREKDQNLASLERQSQSDTQQAKLNRNIFIGSSAALLVLLGLGYSRYRLKQRTNLQLQAKQLEINEQNKVLQSLLTEKDWLLKEVHHRVKNNLQIVMSLLSTQSAYLQNSDAIDAIRESQNRVQSISLIHQKLYSGTNIASIDMPAYITDLISYLRDCFDTKKSNIRFEQLVEPIKMDLAQAVPLGLILNEAITNAIKYAFAGNGGAVIIALQIIGIDTLLLTIADNGKGLPDDFDIRTASSLGMEMMKALSKQLGGTFEIKSKAGTTVSIEFQLAEILSGNQIAEKNI